MHHPSPAKRPVPPSRFLEHHDQVFGVQAGRGQKRHQFGQQPAIDFDTASHRPEDFNQHKVVVGRGLRIGVAGIDTEVLGGEFDNALEHVGLGHT